MAVHASAQSIPFLFYCPLHAFSVALFLFVPVSLPFVSLLFRIVPFSCVLTFFSLVLFLFPFFFLRFVAFFLLCPSIRSFFLPFVVFSFLLLLFLLCLSFFSCFCSSSVILAFSSWVSSPEPVSVVFLVPAFDLLCTKKPPCPQVRSALHCAWPVGKLIGLLKII